MARGDKAKQNVIDMIQETFGDNFLGVQDKKIYVKASENGNEMVQICISMTCPKTEVVFENKPQAPKVSTTFGWGTLTPSTPNNNGLSETEKANVKRLMETFNL